MELETKLALLEGIYAEHDRFMADAALHCKKGCATCCTRNVTLTSLEAYRILTGLDPATRDRVLALLESRAEGKRLTPSVTTNGFAELCILGKEVPEDESDPAWGPCPVLEAEACPLYSVRPMACRSLVSRADCAVNGFADMDELLLTVNTVFAQYVEHIDGAGLTGNFIDMMLFMAEPGNAEAFAEGTLEERPPLILNHPMKALMVPPEHRRQMEPVIERLRQIRVPSPIKVPS